MHEAGVDVWMFLLKLSLNEQFEGSMVKSAESSQPTLPQTASAAQQPALWQLKRYVEDFVRGSVLFSEDWASQLKTVKIDYNGEQIKLPEATTWADLTARVILRKDQFVNCNVTQQKSFSRLRNGLSLCRKPKSGFR